jgi:hypothetical protein
MTRATFGAVERKRGKSSLLSGVETEVLQGTCMGEKLRQQRLHVEVWIRNSHRTWVWFREKLRLDARCDVIGAIN